MFFPFLGQQDFKSFSSTYRAHWGRFLFNMSLQKTDLRIRCPHALLHGGPLMQVILPVITHNLPHEINGFFAFDTHLSGPELLSIFVTPEAYQ